MLRATALKPSIARQALDEVALASAGRPDEDHALRHIGQAPLAHRPDDLADRPGLDLLHAADRFEAVGRIEHLEQAGVLLLDQLRLVLAHQVAGQPPLELGLQEHVFEVDQAQAGGEVGEFIRSEVGRERPRRQAPLDEAQARLPVGQRHFDGVVAGRAGAQGRVQVGQVLHEQEGEGVRRLELRRAAPAEQRHQQVPVVGPEGREVGCRQERLGVLDDDGHPRAREHQAFEHRQGLGRLAGPLLLALVSAWQPQGRQRRASGPRSPAGLGARFMPSRSRARCSIVSSGKVMPVARL